MAGVILGCDFDTRAVHCVLLDDDTNEARYVPCPIRGRGESAFDAARNVRSALAEHICHAPPQWMIRNKPYWESIWLVGIEDSMYRSAQTVRALARVQGAILAAIPRSVCVLPMPAGEWKALTVGWANASKDDVRDWAMTEWPLDLEPGIVGWSDTRPQDAFDAYAIARAARILNDRAVGAA